MYVAVGGDDQWGNIVAGTGLIRRVAEKTEDAGPFGLTFPLMTTATGEKMGKTAGGAIWLDAEKTSPSAFYQYWRNTDDRDVEKFLALFTFVPMEQIREYGKMEGAALNEAKDVLAFETTKLCHGEEAAMAAQKQAKSIKGTLAETEMGAERIKEGIPLLDLFVELKMTPSKGRARRLVQQGGARINGEQIKDVAAVVGEDVVEDGAILLQAGKKKFHKVLVS